MKYLFAILFLCRAVVAEDSTSVVFATDYGDLMFNVYTQKSPVASRQFIELVKAGVYDGVAISFIDKNYYIQVSSARDRYTPLTEAQALLVKPISNLVSELTHKKGHLSFTLDNAQPRTAESSFSILLRDAPELDKESIIFGELKEGQGVVDRLLLQNVNSRFQPIKPLYIKQASLKSEFEGKIQTMLKNDLMLEMERREIALYVLVLILSMAGILFCRGAHLTPHSQRSIVMLIGAISFFGAFLLLVPQTTGNSELGVGTFLAMVGFYKFMNRFESAP